MASVMVRSATWLPCTWRVMSAASISTKRWHMHGAAEKAAAGASAMFPDTMGRSVGPVGSGGISQNCSAPSSLDDDCDCEGGCVSGGVAANSGDVSCGLSEDGCSMASSCAMCIAHPRVVDQCGPSLGKKHVWAKAVDKCENASEPCNGMAQRHWARHKLHNGRIRLTRWRKPPGVSCRRVAQACRTGVRGACTRMCHDAECHAEE